MQTKFCVDCGNENILAAKYCGACGFAFATLGALNQTGAQPSTPKITPKPAPKAVVRPQKPKQTIVFDTSRSEDDLTENDEGGNENTQLQTLPELDAEFENGFVNLVLGGSGGKPKGVKFEDVANSETKDRRSLGSRRNSGPKNAKAILKSGESKPRRNQR